MGDPLQEEVEGMEIQKGMGYEYPSGRQGFEAPKALKGEADNLELMGGRGRKFHVDEAERGLLGKTRNKITFTPESWLLTQKSSKVDFTGNDW